MTPARPALRTVLVGCGPRRARHAEALRSRQERFYESLADWVEAHLPIAPSAAEIVLQRLEQALEDG